MEPECSLPYSQATATCPTAPLPLRKGTRFRRHMKRQRGTFSEYSTTKRDSAPPHQAQLQVILYDSRFNNTFFSISNTVLVLKLKDVLEFYSLLPLSYFRADKVFNMQCSDALTVLLKIFPKLHSFAGRSAMHRCL